MPANDPARVAAEKIHGPDGTHYLAAALRSLRDPAVTQEQAHDMAIESCAAIIRAAYAERDREINREAQVIVELGGTISSETMIRQSENDPNRWGLMFATARERARRILTLLGGAQ